MKTIWKYELELGSQTLELPQGAQPLSVAVQQGGVMLWALVTPEAPTCYRRVYVVGTGHELPEDLGSYVGTVLLTGGALVFHVFVEEEWTLDGT